MITADDQPATSWTTTPLAMVVSTEAV
jgi:hypothetical protein